jgi:hypothetical protein
VPSSKQGITARSLRIVLLSCRQFLRSSSLSNRSTRIQLQQVTTRRPKNDFQRTKDAEASPWIPSTAELSHCLFCGGVESLRLPRRGGFPAKFRDPWSIDPKWRGSGKTSQPVLLEAEVEQVRVRGYAE